MELSFHAVEADHGKTILFLDTFVWADAGGNVRYMIL